MSLVKLSKKDFQSAQDVRWCPGCGDYAILGQVQKQLAELGVPRENIVFISGIGCSSRFPYYMSTYGFHTIHGRAPGIAAGLKLARPELQVWIVTGDGDALSIGGNHFIHTLRRNMDVKILLFNNQIYGLTKGQFSPTSELGKQTKTTPYGSIDRPFNPLQLALGARATFVARSVDIDGPHLAEMLARVAAHRGSGFLEIYQNCVVFNDGAFDDFTDRKVRDERQVRLVHGQPVTFAGGTKGIRMAGFAPEVVSVGPGGAAASELLVWDERAPAALAFALAELDMPRPVGVFRAVDAPVHHELDRAQEAAVRGKKGAGDLAAVLGAGDTWTVT